MIADSILQFGFTAPLLVDESGVLIYGHGRLAAAQQLELAELPVCIARGWSEEDKAAYRIADNQLALRSDWDVGMLKAEVQELSLSGYYLPLLGFADQQLQWFSEGGELQTDPTKAWAGMPGFEMGDKTAFRSVIVHFKDEAAVNKFMEVVGLDIAPKAKFIWYPEMEIEEAHDKLWAGSDAT